MPDSSPFLVLETRVLVSTASYVRLPLEVREPGACRCAEFLVKLLDFGIEGTHVRVPGACPGFQQLPEHLSCPVPMGFQG